MAVDFRNLDPAELALYAAGEADDTRAHFVELYERESDLVDSVTRFVSAGLRAGDAAIVVADPSHRRAFDSRLAEELDLEAAKRQDLYISLDASETLALFLEDGTPDQVKFERVLGDMIGRATASGRKVRIFGEMVAVLWKAGNVPAALRLEELWNDLAETYPFILFCAYPTASFGDKNPAPLRAVCNRHTHVVVRATS